MMSRLAGLMPLSMLAVLFGFAGFLLTPTHPMILAGSLILALTVIGMAAWSIADQPGQDPFDVRLADAVVLGLTFMVFSVLLLGTLGLLGWWMLVVNAGMAASMWAMVDGRLAFDRRRLRRSRLQISLLSTIAIALGAFAVVQAVLGRIFRPPVGDSLAYHLPFAVKWMQTNSLAMPVPAAGDPSTPFYPLNASAWIFWLLAPFEIEVLARFVQLPFLGLLALGAYRLAREVGVSSPAAAIAAALTISVPSIARSASLPENDLMLAAFLVIATANFLMLRRRFSVWRAGMTAAVIGLAIGTKVIALAFGGTLGAIWLLVVLRFRWREGIGPALKLPFAGAIIVVIVGGYSYVRNTVVMGNPLYPAGYDLPGGIQLDGLYFPTWEWRQNHAFFSFDWQAFFFGMRHDFGSTITYWVIPGVLLAGLLAIPAALNRNSEKDRKYDSLILTIWVAVSLLIFWYVIPYHFSRFLFASIVIGIVAGMWALARLAAYSRNSYIKSGYPLVAVPLILANLINIPLNPAIRDRLIYWVALILVVGGVVVGLQMLQRISRQRLMIWMKVATMAVAMLVMIGWGMFQREYEQRRIDEWQAQIQGFSDAPEAWEWLLDVPAANRRTIAVAGTNEIYPLYGADLENRVVTIWHSGELARYGWNNQFVLYGSPDRSAWQEQIIDSGVELIVLTENVSFGGWPVERDWMLDGPDQFSRAFSNDDIEIWQVVPSSATTASYTDPEGWFNKSDRHSY